MISIRMYCLWGTIILSILAVSSYGQTGGDAIIYPESKGKLIDAFFYDLKQWAGAVNSQSKANNLFVIDGMNGVRISIYGNKSKPGHPSAGVVDESEYASLISSINLAKATRGNSGLKIFASKKLDGQNSFPDWVKDANGIIPSQYAIMLADYIKFMNSKGIEIDVLGIDNERQYNEGNITPQKYTETIDNLRSLATKENFKMPLTIAPEDYGPSKNNWMKIMSQNGWLDRVDIYGTHYYPQYRPKNKLISDLGYAGNRPFWSTEPHWDNKTGQDQLAVAEKAMCALWDQTDMGVSGVMWWAYQLTNLRGYLMRNATVPLLNSQSIDMDDVDGRDISTLGKLQTRAFRKGDLITVYAINMSSTVSYPDYGFQLFSGQIRGLVTYKQWTDVTSNAGDTGTATLISDSKFELTLPQRSITSFTFELNTATGIKSSSSQLNIFIYPNPTENVLNIAGLKEISTFSVYSAKGRKLMQGNSMRLDVAGLSPGLYFLRMLDGETFKFVRK